MIGTGYWATGIHVRYHPGNTGGPVGAEEPREWSALVEYCDDGFVNWRATEGVLRTRYACPTLSDAIDLIRADAERLGIEWRPAPTIYVPQDGEGDDPMPDNWGALIAAECERLGWRNVYEL